MEFARTLGEVAAGSSSLHEHKHVTAGVSRRLSAGRNQNSPSMHKVHSTDVADVVGNVIFQKGPIGNNLDTKKNLSCKASAAMSVAISMTIDVRFGLRPLSHKILNQEQPPTDPRDKSTNICKTASTGIAIRSVEDLRFARHQAGTQDVKPMS